MSHLGRMDTLRLLEDIEKGNLDAVQNFTYTPQLVLLWSTSTLEQIDVFVDLLLHVAIIRDQLDIVMALVEKFADVEIKRKALSLAIQNGMTKIVKCLVETNRGLLSDRLERYESIDDDDDINNDIDDDDDDDNEVNFLPIVLACHAGHKETAYYLYSVTPFDILFSGDRRQGGLFLSACIYNKIFDIALDAIHRCPETMTYENCLVPVLTALAQTPSAFFTATELVFWRRWIYDCVKVEIPSAPASGDIRIDVNGEEGDEGQLRNLRSKLLQFIGIKQLRDLKLTHAYALKTLHLMCEHLSALEKHEFWMSGALEATIMATRNGMLDFVKEITKTNADLIFVRDDEKRTVLMTAIGYRSAEIAKFLNGLHQVKLCFKMADAKGNNVLHMAGKIAPEFLLARISGAAFQMQREVQWYEEVKRIVPQYLQKQVNSDGETPSNVFTREHRDLLKNAEEWMKQTATSYSVVAALIITIMFAAAITYPGGNDQNKGFPMLKNEVSFMIYIISDAVSLFAATTSILMFLGILTSRYEIKDFHKSLPQKLITGLSSLIISIAAMMVSFFFALLFVLERQWGVLIPSMLLAGIPVTLFVWLQFPFLVEICVLTYSSQIFGEKGSFASKIKTFFMRKKKTQ